MKVLKYLYVRFYQLMVSVGNGDIAVFAALMFMTIMFLINFVTIYGIYIVLSGTKVSIIPESSVLWLLEIGGVFAICYFLLAWNGKSAQTLKDFENENLAKRKKGRRIVISYILLSFLFLIFTFYIMTKV